MRLISATVFLLLLLVSSHAFAQSPNGSIRGIVLDPDTKSISGAEIIVVNDVTQVQYETKTNNDGIYAVPNLPPGPYRMQISKIGFKTIIKPDILLNVQDALSLNFTLPIGATSVVVTVEGGAPVINTQDASVSTVVDQHFVENMPLNGRSFQDLILLTPGVVTNSPQTSSSIGNSGEFSVNGQRTESNYYTVDGVSANVGTGPGDVSGAGNSGSLPASSALGTTHALVSVDALQEFRVESSTYSAEFGRNPGGQFSFVTRSGTNEWHGSAFEYLRNNFFDANNWFNNYYGQAEPSLRQNDFGATLGGPVEVPHLYQGKDKTFFFFSYEGLRLLQPEPSSVSYAPTAALRQSAPAALRQVLDAFPLPNCGGAAVNCTNDLGNGLGEFIGTWSNPSSVDAYSIRLDHAIGQKLKLFFRFSDSPSSSSVRLGDLYDVPSVKNVSSYVSRSYTIGANSSFSSHVGNEFRVNYSSNEAEGDSVLDGFGGATPANLLQLQGFATPSLAALNVALYFPGYGPSLNQGSFRGEQRQWNIVDAVYFSLGRHQLKFGVDFRRLTPQQYSSEPFVSYDFYSASSVLSNSVDAGFADSQAPAYPIYRNFSAFAQDEWRLNSRLSLSMGLRWEVNPAPSSAQGNPPFTIRGDINNPSTLTLAPPGTPLWGTGWYNFAPRLGAAYVLRASPGYETVARGGGGVFFDTGQQLGSQGYLGPGFNGSLDFGGTVGAASFPLPPSEVTPVISDPPAPPYNAVYAFPVHLQLPFTLQWNASIEQALGKSQALTMSYVGANGRRLLELSQRYLNAGNPDFTYVYFFQNGLTSDYNALQVQFQRRLNRGLQILASYTWAHSIDYGSFNSSLPYVRGNADYDVRHNLSGALSYEIRNASVRRFARSLFGGWGIDDRFMARTAFPVTLKGHSLIDPATGQLYYAGLDIVPGQPLYVFGAQFPGGRAINPAAFQYAAGPDGAAPRNFVRGFPAWQMDLAIHREIPIHERLKLQLRADSFNLFNHPNFGLVNSTFGNRLFGQATATLNQSLGVLSPLYQMGGPRSMQFALKLMF